MRVERGIGAARRATAFVCDDRGEHKGQGLLLNLGGAEGTVVLTCHHVVSQVAVSDLRVKIRRPDGTLGDPVGVEYDERRSYPGRDAAVLMVQGAQAKTHERERPLLHRLGSTEYDGALEATVFTHLYPDNFDATVRASTQLEIAAEPTLGWSVTPERYRVEAFRLSNPTDSRPGISGGVVVCEGGVLGLAHFGRAEGGAHAREAYLVPLSVWAEGWPDLEDAIEPLVDRQLRGAATVKRAEDLTVGIGADVVVARYQPGVYYAKREADELARQAFEERGGVIVVGKPLSGKSRLALELLLESSRAMVVIPRPDSSSPPEGFEASGFWGEEAVIFVDDLHRVAETTQPLTWQRAFEKATGRPCKVVCTTRDGEDWRLVEERQQRLLRELGKEKATVFTSRVGGPGQQRGRGLSDEQGRELAEEIRITASEFRRRFDGTPGSLLLDLDDMRMRYERLRDEQLGGVSMSRLLDSAKLLFRARQPFLPHAMVRACAERVRGAAPLNDETWEALIRRTREEGFVELDEENGNISYYSPYLERCVLYTPSLDDFKRLQPLMEEAGNLLGLFYLVAFYSHDLNDHERALAVAERAIELDSESASSWYNKSYALNHLGRNEEALEAIGRALSLNPEYHPAYYSKAWALMHLGRHAQSLEAFKEALRRGQGSYPGVLSMYLDGLSAALSALGHFYEAVTAGLRALALYPPYPPAVSRFCNLLCAVGEPTYALEVAENLLDTDVEWPEAWYGKGLALDELGRNSEALEAYDRSTELQSNSPAPWSRKGTVLLEMSDNARGSDKLAKGLGEEGPDAEARVLAQRAIQALDMAIDLGEDDVVNRMNRALGLSRLDRNDEAAEAFVEALNSAPENPLIHHNKGIFHVRMRQYEEALASFEEATRLHPNLAPSWRCIVFLLGGPLDQQEAALYAVDGLIRLRPMDAQAWFAKGCILSKLGRSEEAQFWLRCARSQESQYLLPASPGGRRQSVFHFLGPKAPVSDERHEILGKHKKGPFSSAEDPMQTMRGRFERLSPEQQDVLRALQLLAFANVGTFSHSRLRAVVESDGLFDHDGIRLGENLAALTEQAFFDRPADQDPVLPEFACLLHAVSYEANKHPSEDFDKLADVLEHRLADYEGLLRLGLVCGRQLGDFQKALVHINRSLTIKGNSPEALTDKSVVLGHLGRHADALEAAGEAVALAPGQPAPLYNKGVALIQLGRHTEALEVFEEVAVSWPNDPRVLLGRGEALVELGRADEAVAEAVRAGSIQPEVPDVALHEAKILVEAEDYERALRAIDRVLEARPDDPLALFLKGTVLLTAERLEEASTWFFRAWSVRDQFPDGGAMVAKMLESLGHNPS